MTQRKTLLNGFGAAVLLIGIALHLAGIQQPFLGNFAQHQTDYATVVQRWLAFGIHPLEPVMRFMAEGENRVFLGDVPITMMLAAWLVKAAGLSIEIAGRGLSALFFFLSLFPFYRLAKRFFKEKGAAEFASFFYLFSPLTLIYGQAFLLEMPALSLGLWGFYCLFEGLDRKSTARIALGAFLFSLMMGLRIYYGFILLPVFGIFLHRNGRRTLCTVPFWMFMAIAVSVPLLWQTYAAHASQAIGQESSLQDNLRVFVREDPILKANLSRFRYYLPVLDILVSRLVTPVGFVVAVLFFFIKQTKRFGFSRFCMLFLASFGILMVLAPRKFVEFEYYYLPLVPLAAFLAGRGVTSLTPPEKLARWGTSGICILTILLALRYAAAPMLVVPDEDRHVLRAAARVQEIVPESSKVIASHGSSTSFLYHTNRDGWAFDVRDGARAVRSFKDMRETAVERLELYRSQGADYFALADKRFMKRNPGLFEHLRARYDAVADTDTMLLYRLHD